VLYLYVSLYTDNQIVNITDVGTRNTVFWVVFTAVSLMSSGTRYEVPEDISNDVHQTVTFTAP
jgi:hypothetical protein